MFVQAYSASQSFLLFLSCGIRVASKSNVDSIPSQNGVLILRCEYQSIMIIEIFMSILFNRRVFSSSGSDHFNIRKINSKFPQWCLFHLPQVSFVFPPSHPFLQGLRYLNQVSILLMRGLFIPFPSMFLPGGFHEDVLLAHHYSFFFLLWWIKFKLWF